MRLFALIAAAFALALPQTASAWGFYAHTITADIAEANVKPETRRAIERLMRAEDQIGTPDCPLATIQDASVWPDCLRGEGWRWAYTFPWHYQTEPITEEYSDRKNCSGGSCVSAQVTRNQRVLADESLPENVRLEALAFLVHFAGDIHMPLHSGDLDDRGGNDRVVDYGIVPQLNLHWIWDGPLAERAISGNPPVVRRYTAAERAELAARRIGVVKAGNCRAISSIPTPMAAIRARAIWQSGPYSTSRRSIAPFRSHDGAYCRPG
jgi:hypothetical protein